MKKPLTIEEKKASLIKKIKDLLPNPNDTKEQEEYKWINGIAIRRGINGLKRYLREECGMSDEEINFAIKNS